MNLSINLQAQWEGVLFDLILTQTSRVVKICQREEFGEITYCFISDNNIYSIVSFLREHFGNHLARNGVQYAASFGAAPKIHLDDPKFWYKRALKALKKAM